MLRPSYCRISTIATVTSTFSNIYIQTNMRSLIKPHGDTQNQLQYVFKRTNIENFGTKIIGTKFNNYRFVIDVVSIRENFEEVKKIPNELKMAFESIRSKINIDKTKFITNRICQWKSENNLNIEQVNHYKYLRPDTRLGRVLIGLP